MQTTYAEKGIDANIISAIEESVVATYTDEDGNQYPMKTDITIQTVPQSPLMPLSVGNDDGNVYMVSVRADADRTSTNTGSSDKSGIEASGTLTMFWKDNTFPTKNILK